VRPFLGHQQLGGVGVVCSASAVTTAPARSSGASSGAKAGTSSGAYELLRAVRAEEKQP
jgi:hypothetical protein